MAVFPISAPSRGSYHDDSVQVQTQHNLSISSMPAGKTSQASAQGKQESKEHLKSAQNRADSKITIWPEWTEAELAAEKWDLGGAKGKDKGKPLSATTLYDDSDGILLPPSLAREGILRKRPSDTEFTHIESPVMVEDPECTSIDIVSANDHLMCSELMCSIISQLSFLWTLRDTISPESGENAAWTPWEHIHPHTKGTPAPVYNPGGKYCVRLYWMGAWRKVTVDDRLPYMELDDLPEDEAQKRHLLLLPATPNPAELWPAILTKAILKIAALDYMGGSELSEFGDCSVIHMFTGWPPQTLLTRVDSEKMWEKLTELLPLWERREEGEEDGAEATQREAIVVASCISCQMVMPLQPSLAREINTSEQLLKKANLIPHDYSFRQYPSFPMLLTRVRDKPLLPPPKEPPPPTLQAPCYLGLVKRCRCPGVPTPPTSPPTKLRFVEITHPFPVDSCDNWMDYEDFTRAFRILHIFRNPTSFAHGEVYSDMSGTVEGTAQAVAGGKKTMSSSQLGKPGSNNVLFVDIAEPLQLQLVFSCISNWREGMKNLNATRKHRLGLKPKLSLKLSSTPVAQGVKSPTSRQQSTVGAKSPVSRQQSAISHAPKSKNRRSTTPDRQTSVSNHQQKRKPRKSIAVGLKADDTLETIVPGSLVVQRYSWRSVEMGNPVMRMATTGMKGAVLDLEPGRNIFKLHAKAPIGYHLEILSTYPVVLTSEDDVFSYLSKESRQFIFTVTSMVQTILDMLLSLKDEEIWRGKVSILKQLHPTQEYMAHDFRLMRWGMLYAVNTVGLVCGFTPDLLFQWRACLWKIYTYLESILPPDTKPLMDEVTAMEIITSRKEATVPDSWVNRKATQEEQRAAAVIQQSFRAHQEVRMERAFAPGTSENEQTLKAISASVELLQPHLETLAVTVFTSYFKLDPSSLTQFPFHNDEWTRGFFNVFSGTVAPLQPHSWCVVLREVFHVSVSQLVLVRLQCPVSTSLLRIVDNDTGEETPRVFQMVAPHVFKPNKRGYTFFVDAWSRGEAVEGGRWVMKVAGSNKDLPARSEGEGEGEEIGTTFHTQEIQEYCLPDRDQHLFRLSLKLTSSQECPVTIQLSTSKHDAYFKLEILDCEEPIASTQGRGHGVIPLCTLSPNNQEETEQGTDPGSGKGHKYILQATVIRDSWPLNDSAWPYIAMIKSVEKLDEGQALDKQNSAKKSKGKEKAGRKAATPHPPGPKVQIDTSKPHWTLRIVTKTSDKECLDVSKDTERADELKSMVQAWEAEQPGRCKKAQESRQKFLDSRALKDTSEEDQSIAVSVWSESSSIPQPPTGPVSFRQIDLSPFTVKAEGPPKVLDEAEQSLRQQERQRVLKEYRAKRQAVLQARNADRELRNETKVKQLELAEQWQSELDGLRNKLNAGREAIRNRHLAQERARKEADLMAQKALEDQAGGRDSKATGKTKGKKK